MPVNIRKDAGQDFPVSPGWLAEFGPVASSEHIARLAKDGVTNCCLHDALVITLSLLGIVMSISAITTISGREFAHNLAGAKRAARTGPVLITDRGQPTFALLAIEDYRRLAGAGFPQRTLLEVMESLPATPEVALEEVRLQGHPRAAELD